MSAQHRPARFSCRDEAADCLRALPNPDQSHIVCHNSWSEANIGPDAEIVVSQLRQRRESPHRIFQFIARNYSFAVPSPQLLEKLHSLGRLIDLGAGNGYWAHRLRQVGADIIAVEPSRTVARPVFPTIIDDHRAIVRYPGRVLLMVWPTRNNSWAGDAVKLFGGNVIAYIGDPKYKETANQSFPVAIADGGFTKVEEIDVGSWPHFFEDKLIIWKRERCDNKSVVCL